LLIEKLTKNLSVISLVLVALSIVSYMGTLDAIVFWTNWGGQVGEIGGVLDYRVFGQSVVYHVTKDNAKGEALFSFFDVTAYLLAAVIVLSSIALYRRGEYRFDMDEFKFGGAVWNLIVASFSILAYIFGTMIFIERSLNYASSIGGSVYYQFPFAIRVTHVYQWRLDSPNWMDFDFALWLQIILIISLAYAISTRRTN